jgi:hypothetical protein
MKFSKNGEINGKNFVNNGRFNSRVRSVNVTIGNVNSNRMGLGLIIRLFHELILNKN